MSVGREMTLSVSGFILAAFPGAKQHNPTAPCEEENKIAPLEKNDICTEE